MNITAEAAHFIVILHESLKTLGSFIFELKYMYKHCYIYFLAHSLKFKFFVSEALGHSSVLN